MKRIKGDLILTEDTTFVEDLKVEGNISGKDGFKYKLTVKGDLNCFDLHCFDLNCFDLDCGNLDCLDLHCRNLNFYAVAIAYNSFKCKSWKANRKNYIIKCLYGEIKITEKGVLE